MSDKKIKYFNQSGKRILEDTVPANEKDQLMNEIECLDKAIQSHKPLKELNKTQLAL